MCAWCLASGGMPELGSFGEGRGGGGCGCEEQKVKVPSSHCDSRVRTVCADAMALLKDHARALSPQGKGFSVILSDMCPIVSGITTKDAALSIELGRRALSLAVGKVALPGLANDIDDEQPDANEDGVLRRGGNLVIKLLESEDTQGFSKFCKLKFKKASMLRPKATRSCSREIYLICQGFK
ncbi:hypothetical protein J5N97_002366 [Dioscorea zingiberensis]|uniref:rRNA methyltransferase 2, mitochondrial n=1 Tax=Dioscorea zingiberensis TaxID=325984 RepID=A0A9D5D4N0_9LILI|nr:hypothetical protein J5N97_002366 [Dioscorea zingiberensis]